MLLSSIVTDICTRVGLDSTSLNTTALTDDVLGYQIPRQMPARTALETLMAAYPFDAAEEDWKLVFKRRGSTSVATIASSELRAHKYGEQPPSRAVEVRTQDLELPTHFNLSYESKIRDYDIATQPAFRVDKPHTKFSQRESRLGIVLTDDYAKQLSEIILKQLWSNRHRYSFSTTYKYLKLAPGDVITVSGKFMRIVEMADRDGVIDFICEAEQSGNYQSQAASDDLTKTDPVSDLTASTYIPKFIAMDIPAIDEDFGNAGLTFAMYGSTSYKGGTIEKSLDGNVWAEAGLFSTVSAKVGNVSNALSSGISGIIDYSTTLTVDLSTSVGTLATINSSQLWAGGNLAAVGTTASGFEILQFLTATSSTGYTYTLGGFLRGLYGTENYRTIHTTSDKFVLLTDTSGTRQAGVDFVSNSITEFGSIFLYKAVNPNGDAGTQESHTVGRKTLDPYAPQIAYGSRNSSNDLEVGWYRGDRYEFTEADLSTVDTIQSEVNINYSIDVIHPVSSAVLRTVATTASTWTYTAAMQSTDAYPQTHPIVVDIYQTSTVTSTRGQALRASI